VRNLVEINNSGNDRVRGNNLRENRPGVKDSSRRWFTLRKKGNIPEKKGEVGE